MRKLALIVVLILVAVPIAFARPHHWMIAQAKLADLVPASAPATTATAGLQATPWAHSLIAAAEAQIGVTTIYDGTYRKLAYPGGDVERVRGVCTDVLVRALRDAHGLDLQKAVHEDMKRAFSSYPANWGLTRPDSNIDHRRVPNLRRFFARRGAELAPESDFLPGDIVTWMLGPGLPHIGIVSERLSADGSRPLIVHNVGAGTRLDDFLHSYPITGHYRIEGRL